MYANHKILGKYCNLQIKTYYHLAFTENGMCKQHMYNIPLVPEGVAIVVTTDPDLVLVIFSLVETVV